MNIILDYQPDVASAPAGFEADLANAVSVLDDAITNPFTVTIQISYEALDAGTLTELQPPTFAGFEPTYTQLVGYLTAASQRRIRRRPISPMQRTWPGSDRRRHLPDLQRPGESMGPATGGILGRGRLRQLQQRGELERYGCPWHLRSGRLGRSRCSLPWVASSTMAQPPP